MASYLSSIQGPVRSAHPAKNLANRHRFAGPVTVWSGIASTFLRFVAIQHVRAVYHGLAVNDKDKASILLSRGIKHNCLADMCPRSL